MISVVIPLYNKAHVILNTLKTVFSQTYIDFEVIIVDDGSTDNGVDVINSTYANNARVRIIMQENQGVSVARNRGIEEAKGDYVSLLDGDDEWHPEYLEHVAAMIEKYPSAGMYCTAGIILAPDGITPSYRVANKYIGQTLEIDYFENPDVFTHTSATTLSKKVFMKSHRFPVGQRFSQDLSCFYEIGLMAQVIYCAIPLSKYIGGVEGQATSNKSYEVRAPHVLRMLNTFASQISEYKNISALVFFKYDLRHRFKTYLRIDKCTFAKFFDGLSCEVKKNFSILERFIYENLPVFAILYINITKVRWRMRGYTVRQERVDLNKLDRKYTNW